MFENGKSKWVWMPLIPGAFYAFITVTYIMNAQIGFNMSWTAAYIVGVACAVVYLVGIILYGMFTALIVPPARQNRPICIAVVLALVCSCVLAWVPVFKTISAGISIVICTVLSSTVCALLFPVEEPEKEAQI